MSQYHNWYKINPADYAEVPDYDEAVERLMRAATLKPVEVLTQAQIDALGDMAAESADFYAAAAHEGHINISEEIKKRL